MHEAHGAMVRRFQRFAALIARGDEQERRRGRGFRKAQPLNSLADARPMQIDDDKKRLCAGLVAMVIIGPQARYIHVRAEVLECFAHALARQALVIKPQDGARRMGAATGDERTR